MIIWRLIASIAANGTAIKEVSVTRRSQPATYPGSLDGIYPGGEEGMACVFAVQVRNSVELYVYRGTKLIDSRVFIPVHR
jgi:hypothetical protein